MGGVAGADYEAGSDYYDYGGWGAATKKQWDKDWTTKKQWDKDWTTKKQWDTTWKKSTWKSTWKTTWKSTWKPKWTTTKKIPCNWNDWQHWSYISATCGKQTRIRSRNCSCPDGRWGRGKCIGSSSKTQVVDQGVCPTTVEPYTPAPYLEGKRRKRF